MSAKTTIITSTAVTAFVLIDSPVVRAEPLIRGVARLGVKDVALATHTASSLRCVAVQVSQ
jgi:hypothetical protein